MLRDDTYVTTGADGETMTAAQRKVVRDLLVAWFAVGAVVGLVHCSQLLGYYGTWIWHCINQNLRVAMIERAEHLSLKYHSHARVGDAIFRVYQDSSMIINVVQQGIVGTRGNGLMPSCWHWRLSLSSIRWWPSCVSSSPCPWCG